jgi:hypothetical protein
MGGVPRFGMLEKIIYGSEQVKIWFTGSQFD